MARARNIKPSFFQNDALAELPAVARLLFIGMWTIADFKGCIEFRPKRIKAQLLPYDDVDVEALISTLDKSRFVTIYSVGANQYVKITNFEKHQNPHPNEKKAGSEIPDLSACGAQVVDFKGVANSNEGIVINRDENVSDPADSLFPLPDSPIPQTTSAAAPAVAGEEGGDGDGAPDASESAPTLQAAIPVEAPAFTLPLNTGDEYPIMVAQVAELGGLYPAVDVMQELKKMRGWLLGSPTRRKTKAGIMRFVTSWLAKQQDDGGGRRGDGAQRTNGRPSINAPFTPGADDDIFNQLRRG